ALTRFGSPRRSERAISFGKAALVDNSAALIRKAGREGGLGPRYVDVIRQRAAALFRLPLAESPEVLDERLESLNPRHSFAGPAARSSPSFSSPTRSIARPPRPRPRCSKRCRNAR